MLLLKITQTFLRNEKEKKLQLAKRTEIFLSFKVPMECWSVKSEMSKNDSDEVKSISTWFRLKNRLRVFDKKPSMIPVSVFALVFSTTANVSFHHKSSSIPLHIFVHSLLICWCAVCTELNSCSRWSKIMSNQFLIVFTWSQNFARSAWWKKATTKKICSQIKN